MDAARGRVVVIAVVADLHAPKANGTPIIVRGMFAAPSACFGGHWRGGTSRGSKASGSEKGWLLNIALLPGRGASSCCSRFNSLCRPLLAADSYAARKPGSPGCQGPRSVVAVVSHVCMYFGRFTRYHLPYISTGPDTRIDFCPLTDIKEKGSAVLAVGATAAHCEVADLL